jgi:hypothetical protein
MTNSGNSKKTNENPDIEKYFENTVFKIKDKKGNLVSEKKYSELTEKEKTKIPPPPPPSVIPPKKIPTKAELEGLLNRAKFALWIDNNPVDNSELNKYNSMDFVLLNGSFVNKNARSKKFPQEYQMNLYTEKGYEKAFLDKKQTYPKVIEWTIENDSLKKSKYGFNSKEVLINNEKCLYLIRDNDKVEYYNSNGFQITKNGEILKSYLDAAKIG